ncbi:hypothetical protein QBC36DRAFT_338671 [Triangularia setosa]|uniref:Gag1-like clamp domain-containing protein n=1 Tax=Triangularia setosa TaxID=2587417 RepID=A0AAN6VZC4_9PEZI|nr:hypothetical protein QBC36DRAFT_338671 [Podospora setosa]
MHSDEGGPEAPTDTPINKDPAAAILGRGHQQKHVHVHVLNDTHDANQDGASATATDTAVRLTSPDLGGPGLLGSGIIPLSAPVTPHSQHHPGQRQLPPVPPIYYKDTPAAQSPSREVKGDDHDLSTHHHNIPPTMIFSDLYKSPRSPFSKLRNSLPHHPPPPSDIDADLVSKDKTKQKEAVKRYLAERVKNDWEFTWPPVTPPSPATAPATVPVNSPPTPAESEQSSVVNGDAAPLPPATGPTPTSAEHVLPPTETTGLEAGSAPQTVTENETEDDANRDSGEEADSESDAESVYSTISEDLAHFQPRAEWTSDLSDDDGLQPVPSPFRFNSPDDVGTAVRSSLETKRTRRRRAVREEASWNPGLACFEARRDAWTGARTVRVKPKPIPPTSPSTGRRLSFWRLHRTESASSQHSTPGSPPAQANPINPMETRTSHQTDVSAMTPPLSESDSAKEQLVHRTSSHESTTPPTLYPVETLVPVPAPLLPPQNPMRASITPSMYSSLYDKLVIQGLQPACPVNLSDMIRACVVGWKRDGEWPPRSNYTASFPVPVATTTAELVAMRQRKAQQQQKINAARKAAASTSPPVSSPGSTVRRMSFGFLGKTTTHEEHKDNSHSDETGSGKALFRRSLQRVLSLGQHNGGHNHHPVVGSPPQREVMGAALGAAMT